MDGSTVFLIHQDAQRGKRIHKVLDDGGLQVELFLSVTSFLSAYEIKRGGCMLLDCESAIEDGFLLLREILSRNVLLPLIAILSSSHSKLTVECLYGGGETSQCSTALSSLCEHVMQAIAWDAEQRRAAVAFQDFAARLDSLSPRERQILDLTVDGKSIKEIAHILTTSKHTVGSQHGRMLTKMKIRSDTELVKHVLTYRRRH